MITLDLKSCSSDLELLYPRHAKLFTPDKDLSVLLWLAEQTSGNIVEVGCNEGLTTLQLAYHFGQKVIYGVDCSGPFVPACQRGEQPGKRELGRWARKLPNAQIIDQDGARLDYALTKGATMVFLDSDHTYKGTKKHTERALDYLSSRSKTEIKFLVWHDFIPEWMGGHPEWLKVGDYVRAEIEPKYPIWWANETTVAWIQV